MITAAEALVLSRAANVTGTQETIKETNRICLMIASKAREKGNKRVLRMLPISNPEVKANLERLGFNLWTGTDPNRDDNQNFTTIKW